MSNIPPNPYSNTPVAPLLNANHGSQMFIHNVQSSQIPGSQLPPSYGMKPDSNSNSPAHASTSSPNNIVGHVQKASSYNQSGSSSPAFSNQGMMPPTQSGVQPSPIGPPMKVGPTSMASHNLPPQNVPMSSPSPGNLSNANSSPIPHFPRFPNQQQRQINDNAPPLIPSSQYNQPLMNGPPGSFPPNQYPVSTSAVSGSINAPFGQPQVNQASTVMKPPVSVTNPQNLQMPRQPNNPPASSVSFPGPQFNSLGSQSGPAMGPPRTGVNGPLSSGPSYSGPAMPSRNLYSASPSGPPSGQFPLPVSGTAMGAIQNQPFADPYKNGYPGPPMKHPPNINNYNVPQSLPSGQRPPMGPQMGPAGINRPPGPHSGPTGFASGPPGPPSGPTGLASGPPGPPSGPTGLSSGPPGPPSGPTSLASGPIGQPGLLNGPPGSLSGPTNLPPGPPSGHPHPPSAPLNRPPGPSSGYAPPSGHAGGQPVSSIQNRYPQMSQGGYNQPNIPPQPNVNRQYGYNAQGITQQMGQLSVTHQGFDQLWGHQMFDLMQCRQIHPEYPEDPPEIKLGHQFADSPNCSPEIFRCTINRIPETNSLLQRSRLPLGILIHPFKDLNHLPVIQCTTIVRCRACRTYINPFVYFVDSKRWKCNLCYRVNDLPEEFQYDPVSKSYGDPSRRPEIKSATIEFIAPSEYMLRPPQPAVYLFLMDVSQIARESGYLQVFCECLKSNLEQLPGDARTQVGFICYDSHVHYYLMSDGLTRPKEMTVLDIDDVFLPSPESLLVNLGERRELVRELLSSLPQRHSTPGVPASALGAALQAAYKLMSPTGGRITVFQTCLPNIGPGALQSREDPNARSSKEVAHLNPATDFYKRLALDCSGAQVAVDLFLLNSQYCDLATLSGMSKFSAGSVYHIPLFNAARGWQADKLRRMLGRYLTRKIGFEAVMRVRATRGISIHTFHGNFFVRSTDLLSLPNVSPDAGFGMQLTIDEALSDLQQVCFQAALLYTSSKGERRIRVHTLALPIASSLTDVLHSADQQCIIGLLSKMGVDRAVSASLGEAREALLTVAVDILAAHRLAQNLPAGPASASLHAPSVLRLLPLYLHALLKRKAFRTGTSTRLDDRVADMGDMKCLPLAQLMRAVYPDLYPVHALHEYVSPPCDYGHDHDQDQDHEHDHDHDPVPDPPRMHLTAERINMDGAYLLDEGETMVLYVCSGVSQEFLSQALGVSAHAQLPDEARSLPALDTPVCRRLRAFIDRLNDDRPYAAELLLIKDTSPTRVLFTERLLDDRVESAFSYYEFLQHVKAQVK